MFGWLDNLRKAIDMLHRPSIIYEYAKENMKIRYRTRLFKRMLYSVTGFTVHDDENYVFMENVHDV